MKKYIHNTVSIALLTFLGFYILTGCKKDGEMNTQQNGLPGSITRFAVLNNYLYALDQNRVLTYDVSNSSNMIKVSELKTDFGLETITIYEGTIYIGSRTALYILGLDNPAAPELLSKSERDPMFSGGCDPVVVKGDYAYSTIKIIENICGTVNQFSRLLVYNVNNPENPSLIGEYEMNIPNGLGYKENTLFVCDEGADQVILFNISNPTNLSQIGAINLTDPVDVIVNADRMVVSTKTGFSFYNIADINNIQDLGTISF